MLTRQEAITRLTAPGQRYELTTVAGAHGPLKVFVHAPTSLRELYADTATDAPFIVYDDERWSFREAHAAAGRMAHVLVHRFGIEPGDRVAISMRNYPEWIIAFTAITSIGGVAVAMNSLWQPDEMEYGLRNSGAKVLFADQERLDRLAQCAPDLSVQVIAVRPAGDHGQSWSQLMSDAADATMPDIAVAPTDPATIFYTSGSTGHPKGVVSSHRNVLHALLSWELDAAAAALQVAAAADAAHASTPDEIDDESSPGAPALPPATLLAVPLFHVTGANAVYLSSYRAQCKVVCMYKWDPEQAAELIEREQVTSVVAPAAMTGDLLRVARATNRDLSSLRRVGGGGAPRAPEQVRQIGSSFQHVAPTTGWGMTETNAIGAGIAGADYLGRPESSGRCSAVLELRVVDDAGNTLPAGERGELLVRGTSVFAGYWNRPEVNADVFVDGDWFRTGDVAYLDDEGFLFIVDRIKDLIIRGGENIGCGQVEAALLQHPRVLEAAVYAVPDERLGEEVGATVYAEPGLDRGELLEFVAQHLARFEVPTHLQVRGEPLPRTPSGKILKRQLRDEAVTGSPP